MKNRIIETIGALLVMLGIGAADSPNLLIPVVMIVVGGILFRSVKEERDGRETDR